MSFTPEQQRLQFGELALFHLSLASSLLELKLVARLNRLHRMGHAAQSRSRTEVSQVEMAVGSGAVVSQAYLAPPRMHSNTRGDTP